MQSPIIDDKLYSSQSRLQNSNYWIINTLLIQVFLYLKDSYVQSAHFTFINVYVWNNVIHKCVEQVSRMGIFTVFSLRHFHQPVTVGN